MQYKKESIPCWEEYQVDTNGIVYGKNGKPLRPSTNRHGYKMVTFIKDGYRKTFSVHKLVALQFLGIPESYEYQVNHKDGKKDNNNVDNLEWTTSLENRRHAIDILGYDFRGEKNVQAKRIVGKDRNNNIIYDFPSLADAGRFFCNGDESKYRFRETSIIKQMIGIRKTYKGCTWEYI